MAVRLSSNPTVHLLNGGLTRALLAIKTHFPIQNTWRLKVECFSTAGYKINFMKPTKPIFHRSACPRALLMGANVPTLYLPSIWSTKACKQKCLVTPRTRHADEEFNPKNSELLSTANLFKWILWIITYVYFTHITLYTFVCLSYWVQGNPATYLKSFSLCRLNSRNRNLEEILNHCWNNQDNT